MLNETAEMTVYRYIKTLGFMLKYSDRKELLERFYGFIDGLSWSDFITPYEHLVLRGVARSCYKSIIRHYKKTGEWRE